MKSYFNTPDFLANEKRYLDESQIFNYTVSGKDILEFKAWLNNVTIKGDIIK